MTGRVEALSTLRHVGAGRLAQPDIRQVGTTRWLVLKCSDHVWDYKELSRLYRLNFIWHPTNIYLVIFTTTITDFMDITNGRSRRNVLPLRVRVCV